MTQALHKDALASLDADVPLRTRLVEIHAAVRAHLPFIARIAVAVYDAKTAMLRTFVHSSGGDDPLPHYEAPLAQVPSLRSLLDEGHPRVINRMLTFEAAESEHARRLGRSGYAASYTLPIFAGGTFFGFVFFNSRESDVLNETALAQLDVFGHLVSLMVVNELSALRTLSAAIESARHMVHARDSETGSHLDRMSRYARLVAKGLAGTHGLDDEYVERIHMYAPLHDIGKIGIPDAILLKPGDLTAEEEVVMRTHAERGRRIIDGIIHNFGLRSHADIGFLRNIALCHHEFYDGRGYPQGLAGEAIPLEARIVSAADVFDAITSRRPYKAAIANDRAFGMFERLAGNQLDPHCVAALLAQREEIERIQARFREDALG